MENPRKTPVLLNSKCVMYFIENVYGRDNKKGV